MDYSPPGSSCPWDSQSKNTEVDYHALLQGIFQTQEVNHTLFSKDLLMAERVSTPNAVWLDVQKKNA